MSACRALRMQLRMSALAVSMVLAIIANALVASSVAAQGLTDSVTHAPPTTGSFPYSPPGTWMPGQPGFPLAGQSYVDPVFGTTIRRLTNNFPSQSYSDIYGTNGWWNADSTRFYHRTGGGSWAVLDTATGAVVRANVPSSSGGFVQFDPVDPNVYYYISGVNLRQYNIATGADTVLKAFPATLLCNGGANNFIDRTGRLFAVLYSGAVHIWDRQTDTIYAGSVPVSITCNAAGSFELTPSGRYMVTDLSTNQNWFSYRIDTVAQTLSTTGVLFWTLSTGHHALASPSDGKDYFYSSDVFGWPGGNPGVWRVDVALPQVACNSLATCSPQYNQNVLLFRYDWNDAEHFACATQGANQDWCFTSVESSDDLFASQGPWRPYKSEIVATQMVPPFTVSRLVHHRTRSPGADYYFQPRLSASWDGTKVAWASNFGYNAGSVGYSDIYIAELNVTNNNNPVPTVTSLSPTSTTAGGGAFTLTVNGTNFVSGSVVQWNANARTTTFVSATQLRATITAADIATAGTASVRVSTPPPGGGNSNALTFTINVPANPVPTLGSLVPSSATAGTGAFTLTVNGTNFVSGSVVRWNSSARTTTFVSGTQLRAAIPASDVATAGTASVTVFSPTPGGGTSGALTFTINNPVPTLGSLSPSTATSGAAPFTLTVNGTNYVSGSVVRWNGGARTTTFVSGTQLQAAIPASDVATAGTASVTVFSPTPGGGTSGALTFTINNSVPTIGSLTPGNATAGAAAFTLTVNGTNFVSGSVVQWNSGARVTTFVSSTQLQAAITAGDIATAGTASVTVFSPTPGGGTSGALTFTVNSAVPPGAATLVTPSGSIATTTPTFTWNAVAAATQYLLWVDDSSGGRIRTTYTAAQTGCASGIGTCAIAAGAVLNPGAGQWWIVTSNVSGSGPWSSAMAFTVAGTPPPPAATLVAPSGNIATATPTFTWNAVANATQYLLWVDDSSGGRSRATYTAAQAGCASGTGTCSLAPGITLNPGAGQWWVVTSNAAGSGPWSNGLSFTVPGTPPPPAATIVAPSGSLTTATPTFTWNAVASATAYMLWVDDSSGGRSRATYTRAQAGCSSGTGTCSLAPGLVLNPGAGQWWVVTSNASGSGPWSNGLSFTVPGTPPPGAATLVAPSGSLATKTPTYAWNAAAGATQYLLWVDDSSGGRIRTTYTAAQAGCASGTGTCSLTPSVVLASGAGVWWVVSGNASGNGPWSSGMTFTAP